MKVKIKISGFRVHDVGYRYFLLSLAMSNRIRSFEAHNVESNDGEEVWAFADGEDEAIAAFCSLVESKRPARSVVTSVIFDDFEGEVMKIEDYVQFCTTVQLNKAIPVLLEIRDNTRSIPQILGEVKSTKEDIQPGYSAHFRQVEADVRPIKERLGMQAKT